MSYNRIGMGFNPQPEPPGKQMRRGHQRRAMRGCGDYSIAPQSPAPTCPPGQYWWAPPSQCVPWVAPKACKYGSYLWPQPVTCVSENISHTHGLGAVGDPCPPGQWGIPPLCYSTGAPGGGPSGQECPAGSFGYQPYCYALPGTTPSTPPPSGQTPNAACPSATPYGFPPYCYAAPTSIPGLPTIPGLPAPSTPATPIPNTPPVTPGVPSQSAPGGPPGPVASASGPGAWWSARSQNEKIAVAGAGALVLLLALTALKGKKRHVKNPKG